MKQLERLTLPNLNKRIQTHLDAVVGKIIETLEKKENRGMPLTVNQENKAIHDYLTVKLTKKGYTVQSAMETTYLQLQKAVYTTSSPQINYSLRVFHPDHA